MKMARREFLVGTGAFVAAPALANLRVPVCDTAGASSTTTPPDVTSPSELIFRIDGWSAPHEAHDEVLFTVNQSWRTAWR